MGIAALRKTVAFSVLVVLLSGCASSATRAPTPSATTFPHTTIDPTTITGKLLMGYQGWFGCPNDGSRVNDWLHWLSSAPAVASNIRVDMWPDTSELNATDRCPTQMSRPDGTPAYLYSAYDPRVELLHFQWMAQYGIDGVMLQRFTSGLRDPVFAERDNTVTHNVLAAAQATGRVFNIMYDVSGDDAATFIPRIEADWKYLVDTLNVTESARYLRQGGKPVLAIWGLGFTDHPGSPAQAMELVNFFEKNSNPKYQVTLMGGVPTYWRTLHNDAQTDPGFAAYYCALNIISPWTVGRYQSDIEVDQYARQLVAPDLAKAKECGAQYMPVVSPGTSFHNASGSPVNEFARRGGRFYWRQVSDFLAAGATMLYNAMFDEVDEGTAMYKTAPTAADQPAGAQLVSLDADGEAIPNDWYLRLAGEATKMLRKDAPLTAKMPLTPTPAPGSYPLQIRVETTSDWTVVSLLAGGELVPLDVSSYSPSPDITAGWSDNQFTLNQPAAKAGSVSVNMVVDTYLREVTPASTLHFRIERGGAGSTTVVFSRMVGGKSTIVKTVVWSGTGTGERNPYDVAIPAAPFIS
jgi:hypothetical protein